jgi:predicted dehydrogenase
MSTPVQRTGRVGVAVIGAGVISKEYLTNLTSFPDVQVHIVADMFPEVAAARAAEFGVPASGSVEDALNHPDVEIVVNLTIPAAHVEVATAAVTAGKHVWSEKPFSLDRASGAGLLEAADAAGIRLGCAPDTFLGAGLQTALRMVARGDIGVPLTALTLMQSPGPESWHPNPAFLFQEGAGPLFDIGPYYLTTLVQTFGAITKVAGFGSTSRPTRTIGSGPKAGEVFDVTVPSHVSAIVQFANGESSQSIFSFDSPLKRAGLVEVTGTEATLAFPDPNTFTGDLLLTRRGADEPEVIAAVGSTATRGSGVLEMARALREGRPHRAQGAMAYHVLDAMVSISESIDTGGFVSLSSTADAAQPLPEDWDPFESTLA